MKKVFEKIKELLCKESARHTVTAQSLYKHGFSDYATNEDNMAKGLDKAIEIVNRVETEFAVGNNDGWILTADRLPKFEEVVEITYVSVDWNTKEKSYHTARGFLEDGTLTIDESSIEFSYHSSEWEYDEEKDDCNIPKGWYSYEFFSGFHVQMDEKVIAWRPLPEPYKEEEECVAKM